MPSNLVGMAYSDCDIPVMPHRYLMQPMVLAKLLQAAQIQPADRALDLATATGYSTVALALWGR